MTELIHAEFGPVNCKVHRSRRRIAIGVDGVSGQVQLLLPPFPIDMEMLLSVINQHTVWIRRRLAAIKKLPPEMQNRKFAPGGKFFYLGQAYPLSVEPYEIFDGSSFVVSSHSEELVKIQLRRIYYGLCRNYLGNFVAETAERFQIEYRQLKITSALGRWGSCSSSGNLNFPWNLVMCPEPLIEYVVVHELAHRLQMNHSEKFWCEVERMLPDYRERRSLLKKDAAVYGGF